MKLELEKININHKTPEEVSETIGQLIKIVVELKKENDFLQEQLNNNSNNSSLPPSRDIKKKKKIKAKTEKTRGSARS